MESSKSNPNAQPPKTRRARIIARTPKSGRRGPIKPATPSAYRASLTPPSEEQDGALHNNESQTQAPCADSIHKESEGHHLPDAAQLEHWRVIFADKLKTALSILHGVSGPLIRKAAPLSTFIVNLTTAAIRACHPSSIAQSWNVWLFRIHDRVFDQAIEKYLFISSRNAVPLETLTIRSTHKSKGTHYRPTPSLVFNWAMKLLPEDLKRYTFVDYGAGRGRVLLLASKRNFRQVTGCEFAAELHDDTLMNIAQFPRSLMKCRQIECENITATRFPVPSSPAVFYFYRPFNEEIFKRVFDRIVSSYRKSPRRLYIVLVDFDPKEMIRQAGIFERLPVSIVDGVKHHLFSPLSFTAYQSLA